MVVSQRQIESQAIELSKKSFNTFCENISGMFGVSMECTQQQVCDAETVESLKGRFEELAAVNLVKAEGVLDGVFQLIFDRQGLFILAGLVGTSEQSTETIKSGSLEEARKMSDVLTEAGNLLIGSWDRVFHEGLEKHGHFTQSGIFIGNPWDKPESSIGLDSKGELLFVCYEITAGTYPAFTCGVIFPKVIFDRAEAQEEAEVKAEVQAVEEAEAGQEVEAEEKAQEETKVEEKAKEKVDAETVEEAEVKEKAEVKVEVQAGEEAEAGQKVEAEEKAQEKTKAEEKAKEKVGAETVEEAEVKAEVQAGENAKTGQEVETEEKAQEETKAEEKAEENSDAETVEEAETEEKAQEETKVEEKAEEKVDAETVEEAEVKAEVPAGEEAEAEEKAQGETEVEAEEKAEEKVDAETGEKAEVKAEVQVGENAESGQEVVAEEKAQGEGEAEEKAKEKSDAETEDKAATTDAADAGEEPAGGEVSETIQKMTQSVASLPGESADAFSQICAKDIAQKTVVWCSGEDTVQQALAKMQQSNAGYMMVGTDGIPEGIVSKSDITGAVSVYLRPVFAKWRRSLDDATLNIKVKWIMTRPVQTIKPDTSLAAIMEQMSRSASRCLPVVDQGGKVQSLVTVFDIFGMLSGHNEQTSSVGKTGQAPMLT